MGVGTSRKVGGGGRESWIPLCGQSNYPRKKTILLVLCSSVHGGPFRFLNCMIEWRMKILAKKILGSGGHGPPAPSPVPTPMELAKKRASKSKGSQMMPLNTSATCRSSKHQTWHLPVRSTLCNPSVKGRVRLGTILWILQSQPQKWMYLLLVLS